MFVRAAGRVGRAGGEDEGVDGEGVGEIFAIGGSGRMAVEEEDMLVLRSSGTFSATKADGYFNSKPSAYSAFIENVEGKYVKDPFPTAFGEKASLVLCLNPTPEILDLVMSGSQSNRFIRSSVGKW